MKSLLGEEHSFIIESDDDDDNDEEDPTHGDAGAADEDEGSSSDSSSSCATPRAGGGDGSHPNSYTNEWPQSYRYFFSDTHILLLVSATSMSNYQLRSFQRKIAVYKQPADTISN
jgi:vesicular inhibitory amino acid transporter